MSSFVFGFSHSALYFLKQEATPLLSWGRRRRAGEGATRSWDQKAWAVLGQPVAMGMERGDVQGLWPVAEVEKAAEWI